MQVISRKWCVGISLGLSLLAMTAAVQAAAKTDVTSPVAWGYSGETGAENWGKLSPSFKLCSEGKEQSPIDIEEVSDGKGKPLVIHYQPAPLWIKGESAKPSDEKHPQLVNLGYGIQVNLSQARSEYITIGKDKFRLTQFHFHTPGENKLKGDEHPMEIHFVHQGAKGKYAVVGVWVKEGEANPALAKIIENLPPAQHKLHKPKGVTIDPNQLLPKDRKYYQFAGSLTTPPCTEGITWQMMATPIEASEEQIEAIKKAIGVENSRPVQALHDRKVVELQ